MSTIAYTNPWVPPEWISAHGMQPQWLVLRGTDRRPLAGLARGVCPYAGAVIDAALAGLDASALVLTTTCDQMRYAAALLVHRDCIPVFLMNVPSTWQSAAARQLFRDELTRLGRFLVRLGGITPGNDQLVDAMLRFDRARSAARAARDRVSARQFASAVAALRSGGALAAESADDASRPGIPLALVGGPLVENDYEILDLIEQAGGRVVLDATEGGERTLPAEFDRQRIRDDPLEALLRAYLDGIPEVFHRPNRRLYTWLGAEIDARGVRGILFRRYVWCDLWHAELHRLRQWSPVPVLELDADRDDQSARTRTLGRLEALLETLR